MKSYKSFSVIIFLSLVLTYSLSSCTKTVYVPAASTTPEPSVSPSPSANRPIPNMQIVSVPCEDLAYDKPGEYMAGLGVASDCSDMEEAMLKATENGIKLMTAKYVGMMKNAIDRYNKDTTIPSGQKIKESLNESGQRIIGSKAIEKFAVAVCHKYALGDAGGWNCFVALHVPVEKIQEEIKEDLAVKKVDYDAQKFFNYMDGSLAK